MVTTIEIIANILIIVFVMMILTAIIALVSFIAFLFGKKFKPFFKKGLWFLLIAPLL